MLKIGEFSKLSRVSVRMLRHYDEIGLLKPSLKSTMTERNWNSSFLPGRKNWRPCQKIRQIS